MIALLLVGLVVLGAQLVAEEDTPSSLLEARSEVTNPQNCPQNHVRPNGRSWSTAAVSRVLEYRHYKDNTLPYCETDQLPTSGDSFRKLLAQQGGWPEMDLGLKKHLSGLGSTPVIVFSIDHSLERHTPVGVLLSALFCRLNQLDLLHRTIVLSTGPLVEYCKRGPGAHAFGPCDGLHVYSDPRFWKIENALTSRMSFHSAGRFGKLLMALYLLEKGHSVLLSDTDTVWLRDPLPYFNNINASVVAMQDGNCVELNSGYVLYRGDEAAAMLRTAVGTIPDKRKLPMDSDQYLFNCAWAYHVSAHNLQYAVLDDRFIFQSFGWNDSPYEAQGYVDQAAAPLSLTGLPPVPKTRYSKPGSLQLPMFIWHTGCFSGYVQDSRAKGRRQLAALMSWFPWGVQADGQCPPKMSERELQAAETRLYHSCVPELDTYEYNPTCTGGAWKTRVQGKDLACRATVGELLSSADMVFNLGVANWDGDGDPKAFGRADDTCTGCLFEMDACIGPKFYSWLRARGQCRVSAVEIYRQLRDLPHGQLAGDALEGICWDTQSTGSRGAHLRIEPVKQPVAAVHVHISAPAEKSSTTLNPEERNNAARLARLRQMDIFAKAHRVLLGRALSNRKHAASATGAAGALSNKQRGASATVAAGGRISTTRLLPRQHRRSGA